MPIEFSARTEVAAVIERVAARHPDFLKDVLKTLEETYPNINSSRGISSRGIEEQNVRRWYRRFYAAQRQRDIDARVAGTPEVPLPSKPLSETDILLQTVNEKVCPPPAVVGDLTADAIEELKAGWKPEAEADAGQRQINRDKSKLGTALGHYLEKVSAEHFKAFKDTKDPMKVIDLDPILIHPLDLHKDGKGPDFERGPILVIQSFTVTIQGHVFKRDYTLNNSPTTKTHSRIIRDLDDNAKIRSKVKKLDGVEFSFYAKAFWPQEGDQLRGYLHGNDRDITTHTKYFRVQNGALKRISKEEWK